MIQLVLSNNSTLDLPETLTIDKLRPTRNRQELRAPFSNVLIRAGDGLPIVDTFQISGRAYFANASTALNFLFNVRTRLRDVTAVLADGTLIEVHSVDFAAVPNMLDRVFDLTFTLHPANVAPITFPHGMRGAIAVYDFVRQAGEGTSLLRDRVGNNDGVVSPAGGWTTSGLNFNGSRQVAISGQLPSILRSNNWTQIVAFSMTSTTPNAGGVVGRDTAQTFSGRITRGSTGTAFTYTVGNTNRSNVGTAFTPGNKLLHVWRQSANSGWGLNSVESTIVGGGDTTTGNAFTEVTLGRFGANYLTGNLYYYALFNRRLTEAELAEAYRYIGRILTYRGVATYGGY